MHTEVTWQHDTPTHWNALRGSEVFCEITVDTAYLVHSADASLRGSHSTFEAAQAQVEAQNRWLDR